MDCTSYTLYSSLNNLQIEGLSFLVWTFLLQFWLTFILMSFSSTQWSTLTSWQRFYIRTFNMFTMKHYWMASESWTITERWVTCCNFMIDLLLFLKMVCSNRLQKYWVFLRIFQKRRQKNKRLRKTWVNNDRILNHG